MEPAPKEDLEQSILVDSGHLVGIIMYHPSFWVQNFDP
jgi:hypothetical protein